MRSLVPLWTTVVKLAFITLVPLCTVLKKMNNFQIFGPTVDYIWEMDILEILWNCCEISIYHFGPTVDNCHFHIFGYTVFISLVISYFVFFRSWFENILMGPSNSQLHWQLGKSGNYYHFSLHVLSAATDYSGYCTWQDATETWPLQPKCWPIQWHNLHWIVDKRSLKSVRYVPRRLYYAMFVQIIYMKEISLLSRILSMK